MLYTTLTIPRYLASGIKPNHKGARIDKLIYGADTETVHGKPNTIQFYSEDTPCNQIYFVDEHDAAETFLKWCDTLRDKCHHVVYIHNLAFDLVELLYGHHEKLTANRGDFAFTLHGWTIRGVYGSPTFCRLLKGSHKRVTLIDSFSFFRGSLAKGAQLYCPSLPKLRRVSGLGERRFNRKNAAFIDYAMRDAQVTYHIGRAIEELHHEFDLSQCVSIADLAARIFRHRFLTYTIPQPTTEIISAALDSYHGGKNNLTVPAGLYSDVSSIDISSAYPDAMQRMPAFSNGKLYRRYRATRPKSVPPYGVYLIRGSVEQCNWPVLFSHGFKPLSGPVAETWVQGFELNEALSSGEFKPEKVSGWMYDHEKDHQAPAMRGFCEDFYQRKQTEKDKVKRYGYKLILNSITGKFIQTRKRAMQAMVDVDTEAVSDASELLAGGMFHPFIASAITAHTRARIHRLEHHYKALHTATDSVFTQRTVLQASKPRMFDLYPVKKADKLGALEHETTGDVLIVRNKCYVFYGSDGERQSSVFPDKRITKYALHGFAGTVHDLERLAATGARKYNYTHANRLKESVNRNLQVNDFVEREGTLRVDPIDLTPRAKVRI